MSTAHRSAVLFDVDGTLVDSNYLHVMAWLQAFDAVGRPVDAWRIHRAIGMDSARLLDGLLGADASELGDAAKDHHKKAYNESAHLLRSVPGARELITELARREVAIALATSAPPDELALLRAVLDVDDLLAATTNADDVDTAKPEPDLVQVAVHRSGAPVDRTVFVGDSIWDMQAAARAGVACIGVLSGGVGAAELRDCGAQFVCDDVADLLAQLRSSPLAPLL